MTSEDVRAHILQYLFRKKKPVRVGDLKGKTIGMPGSYDDIIRVLFEKNVVAFQEEMVSLSEEGLYNMQQDEQKEKQRVNRILFEDEYDLALLDFLFHRRVLVSLEDVPEFLKKKAYGKGINDGPIHEVLWQLEQQGYVRNPYPQWYGITEDGKDYYQYQIAKFNSNHGGGSNNHADNASASARAGDGDSGSNVIHHTTINQISGGNNQIGSQGSFLHVASAEDPATKELARQQLEDMPKMKWYRKWGFWVTLILGLITIYFGWRAMH